MRRVRRARARARRLELARVGVVGGVLELAVRAQVVRARVRGAAQRALEAAREVHVVVVADVRHHLAAQLAAVQVQRARHALERQPHVPALRACNQRTVTPALPPPTPPRPRARCRSADLPPPSVLQHRRATPTNQRVLGDYNSEIAV